MPPAFLLSNLNDDFLYPIFKKFEYRVGVKVYRTSKWVKLFVEENRIRWLFDHAVLRFRRRYYYFCTPEIEKMIGFSHHDADLHRLHLNYELHPWTPLELAKFRTIVLYSVGMQKMLRRNLQDSVWKDIAAQRGVYEIIVAVDMEGGDLLELLDLAKPRILSYDYRKYVKKAEFFKGFFHMISSSACSKYLKKMQFRFINNGCNIRTPKNLFDYCYYMKKIVFNTFTFHSASCVIEQWLSGVDIGQVEEVEIAPVNIEEKEEIVRTFTYADLRRTAESFEDVSANETIAKLTSTGCGKDRLQLLWLPNTILIRFH